MEEYYVSLVRGLAGYYVKFRAPSEDLVRAHCLRYFGRLWCSVYTADRMHKLRFVHHIKTINELTPIILTDNEDEYE